MNAKNLVMLFLTVVVVYVLYQVYSRDSFGAKDVVIYVLYAVVALFAAAIIFGIPIALFW